MIHGIQSRETMVQHEKTTDGYATVRRTQPPMMKSKYVIELSRSLNKTISAFIKERKSLCHIYILQDTDRLYGM